MQKTKVLYVAILAGLIMQNIFAAEGDLFKSYVTTGKDCYADGSALTGGEIYALVWMKSGFDFKGFNLDGTLVDAVNNDLVSFTRVEDPSRSVTLIFHVDEDYRKAHSYGQYRVVILDTRRVNGVLAEFGQNAQGFAALRQINGWGWADVVAQVQAKTVMASMPKGFVVDFESLLPKDFPQSVITGMETDEKGCVVLKVARTKNCCAYTAEFGDSVANVETSVGAPEQGNEATEDIRINTGKKMLGKGFFSVMAVNPARVLSLQK